MHPNCKHHKYSCPIMKILIPLLALFVLSCQTPEERLAEQVEDAEIDVKARKFADSFIKASNKRIAKEIDSGYASRSELSSPIQIAKARLSTDEYGSTDVVVTVKNISNKKADAIKIGWTLTNNFGEEVDEHQNGGLSQDLLKPGQTDTYRWEIYRTTARKVRAYVYSVHFVDGSTWENSDPSI